MRSPGMSISQENLGNSNLVPRVLSPLRLMKHPTEQPLPARSLLSPCFIPAVSTVGGTFPLEDRRTPGILLL